MIIGAQHRWGRSVSPLVNAQPQSMQFGGPRMAQTRRMGKQRGSLQLPKAPRFSPYQPPTTNHQSPITNHQSPITYHQSPLPLTNHQSPITSHFSL
ncbi:MAG TPA: hypothetical protein VHS80_08260, partial [Chthoniobacterales bacterium]|nr:hypothetical protein [Chthoniobacterales bacterium]